jgi:hypothetical protein
MELTYESGAAEQSSGDALYWGSAIQGWPGVKIKTGAINIDGSVRNTIILMRPDEAVLHLAGGSP